MDTILRQCEAPVKTFNSRWFPASNYRFKWSFIAGQGSNNKIWKKKKLNLFFEVLYRSRGSRGPSGRGQDPSRSWKTTKKWKNWKFSNFLNFIQYQILPYTYCYTFNSEIFTAFDLSDCAIFLYLNRFLRDLLVEVFFNLFSRIVPCHMP